ncbi:hypothetical protein [Sphingobacterium faecium]|uniref:hypothetical protein n=1 Tax=Sphingobacterium faecium TaxID=34087 RepID=UPI00320862BF
MVSAINLCQAQSAKNDLIILINGDSIRTKVVSVNDNEAIIDDGENKMDMYPDQVYRIYNNKKTKVYTPSYIQNSIELVKGSKPEIYRIKTTDRSDPTFAELIADGEIMIYYISNTNFAFGAGTGSRVGIGFTTIKSWFAIKKGSGEIILLKSSDDNALFKGNKQRAINLKRFLVDEPELHHAFDAEKKSVISSF